MRTRGERTKNNGEGKNKEERPGGLGPQDTEKVPWSKCHSASKAQKSLPTEATISQRTKKKVLVQGPAHDFITINITREYKPH